MQRQRVSSSNVLSIGHDPDEDVLEVEFTSGGIYQYLGVSESVFVELLQAASKGRYLNECVKDRYQCVKVR
jgi:hypothetical protein